MSETTEQSAQQPIDMQALIARIEPLLAEMEGQPFSSAAEWGAAFNFLGSGSELNDYDKRLIMLEEQGHINGLEAKAIILHNHGIDPNSVQLNGD